MTEEKDPEFYPTPSDLAELLVDRLLWRRPNTFGTRDLSILEPSAGTGAFIPALSELGTVTAIDPNFDRPNNFFEEEVEWARMSLEELAADLGDERPFDIVCGNPPFSLAEEHLKLIFKMVTATGTVGFLLRSGFLSSGKRQKFFATYPPEHIYILSQRPSFVWSYSCKHKTCEKKWKELPGKVHTNCIDCGSPELSLSKTDMYDYMFAVWQGGITPKETTLSWINMQP